MTQTILYQESVKLGKLVKDNTKTKTEYNIRYVYIGLETLKNDELSHLVNDAKKNNFDELQLRGQLVELGRKFSKAVYVNSKEKPGHKAYRDYAVTKENRPLAYTF